VNDYCGIMKIS